MDKNWTTSNNILCSLSLFCGKSTYNWLKVRIQTLTKKIPLFASPNFSLYSTLLTLTVSSLKQIDWCTFTHNKQKKTVFFLSECSDTYLCNEEMSLEDCTKQIEVYDVQEKWVLWILSCYVWKMWWKSRLRYFIWEQLIQNIKELWRHFIFWCKILLAYSLQWTLRGNTDQGPRPSFSLLHSRLADHAEADLPRGRVGPLSRLDIPLTLSGPSDAHVWP